MGILYEKRGRVAPQIYYEQKMPCEGPLSFAQKCKPIFKGK